MISVRTTLPGEREEVTGGDVEVVDQVPLQGMSIVEIDGITVPTSSPLPRDRIAAIVPSRDDCQPRDNWTGPPTVDAGLGSNRCVRNVNVRDD
jgi:hypothetical protein